MLLAASLIGLTIFLWSSAFVAIGTLVETMPPVALAAFRFLIASICFIPLVIREWQSLGDTMAYGTFMRTIWCLAGAGISGIFGYNILLNVGQTQVDPATASLIVNIVPVLTFLFCCFIGWERFTTTRMLGLCICLGGVAFVIISPLESTEWSFWALLILGAAICQALYFLAVRQLLTWLPPGLLTALSIWTGTAGLIALAMQDMLLHDMSTGEAILLIYLGVGPTALGFLSWSYVLKTVSASTASSFLFLVPLCSLFLSWIFLDRLPPTISFIGGAIVIAGLWLFHTGKQKTRQE